MVPWDNQNTAMMAMKMNLNYSADVASNEVESGALISIPIHRCRFVSNCHISTNSIEWPQ